MNLYEKLNRLDDSLIESKTIVKKKKLTESTNRVKLEVKYETYGRYGDGGDIKTGRVSGSTEVEALMKMLDHVRMYIDSDYAEEFKEEEGRYPTTEEVTDVLYDQNGDGCDFIYWIRNLTTGEMIFDGGVEEPEPEEWDDDIDEMLAESTEQYDLSTLVKDSINHLVNNLSKDPMADDFGDDVCADLEDNYDIDVPQNPVKYADWCDAVMSEVSRQLNNKEEQLTEGTSDIKTYKYPAGSPVSRFNKFLENTSEDLFSTTTSLNKAKSNIESQIKSAKGLTQNCNIKIDETKLIEIKQSNSTTSKTSTQQEAPQQLSMKF